MPANQTFEEANSNYWLGTSDFELKVAGGTTHLCYRCAYKQECIPGSMCNPVVECNHYEESKAPYYICEDVRDALQELEEKINKVVDTHKTSTTFEIIYLIREALEEVKKNWQSKPVWQDED